MSSNQPNAQIELVVLDMAGTTIFDANYVAAALTQAGSDNGYTFELAAVNAVMGIPKPLAIGSLLRDLSVPENELADIVPGLFTAFQRHMMEFYRTAPDVRPIAGVEDVLHELWRRGLHVVLDTGFDRAIVDVVLSRIGWEGAPWLLATVASDEVEQGRPAPDLIHAAMRIAGVTDPAHVTKVGDTPADVQEGLSANCGLVLGVAYGTHTRDELLAAGAHAVIEEPRELTQLLLRQE